MTGSQPPVAPRARLLDLLSLGFSVPIAVVLGGLVGWFADARFGTRPWLFLLGLTFGIVAGLRNVISAASRAAAAAEEDSPPADGAGS